MDQLGWAEITALIVATVSLFPAILNFIRTRFRDKAEGIAIIQEAEKSEAEATGVIVTAATALLDPYIKRVEELEAREAERDIREAERQIELKAINRRLARIDRNNFILCEGVRRLIHQIRSLGAEPVFEIDEELCEEMGNGSDIDSEFEADRLT